MTHLITCQGRDHLVNIQSERHTFVIVNVHFEPELTSKAVTWQIGSYSPALACLSQCGGHYFWVTSTSVIRKKDDNVWNQSFTDGDPGKTAVFHSFFPHVLEVAQSDYTRRDSTALGVIRTLSRIDRIFINLPMAEAREFHCYSHVFENLGTRKPFRVTTQRYVSSFRSQQLGDNRANEFPAGCPKIPFSVTYCSSFMTTTDSLLTHFVHLQNLKFFYTRLRS